MQKAYTRIVWENFPSEKSPLNETNLNRMDLAIDEIDNRVIEMDATKVNRDVANNLVKTWSIDEETGIITVEHLDGSRDIFDLNIEKIPVDFKLSDDGILTMTTDDGSKYTANIGAMIPVLTFNDSDTIAVSVTGTGVNKTYYFSIKAGSVTEDKLQPNFLADIKTESAKAQASRTAAAQSETKAYASESAAKLSETNAAQSAASAENSMEIAVSASDSAQNSANTAKSSEESAVKASVDAVRMVEDVTEKLESGYFVGQPGIQGPKGDKGDKGETGLQGATGATGATGPQGERGIQGPAGADGATGQKGDAGPQGPKGDKGDTGATGATGAQGERGDKGDTGAQGPKGDKGDTGATGATGAAGKDGAAGATGSAGPQGPKGDKGDTGASGATGATGAQGIQGIKGDKGEKGDKGDPGESGITAPVSGFFTLSVDEDGNLWAYSADGGVTPEFEYDSTTGNLYVVQEVS